MLRPGSRCFAHPLGLGISPSSRMRSMPFDPFTEVFEVLVQEIDDHPEVIVDLSVSPVRRRTHVDRGIDLSPALPKS